MKRELLSQRGAEVLCERIESYWRLRGFLGIETKIIPHALPLPNGEVEFIHFVRSNIGPTGFPPKRPQAIAA